MTDYNPSPSGSAWQDQVALCRRELALLRHCSSDGSKCSMLYRADLCEEEGVFVQKGLERVCNVSCSVLYVVPFMKYTNIVFLILVL